MKKKNIYIIGAFFFCIASFAQVKDSKLTKANKLYNDREYFKSSELYEKVANDGYKSVELFEKLGDSYFFNAEYPKANKWYSELFKLGQEVDPIYYYRYSQTLKSVGDDANAEIYLQKFSNVDRSDARAIQFAGNSNYLAGIEDNTKKYVIEDAGVNSAFSDYGSSIYNNNQLIFTSSRNGKKDNWTSDYYSSLYSATLANDNTLSDIKEFAKEIQTTYHESDPVFSKDGKTMFFTRNNDKKDAKKEKKILLKIYKATLENGKWGNVKELPFNSDSFSCAHPALSPDDNTLYFASDMPGGFGDSDIYKIAVSSSYDVIGTPVNLGKNINTQGKETFPWINSANKLYFASDGHLGLGGLDVFVTSIENNTFTRSITNVGKPINSQFDDFAYLQLKDSKTGFFTSNREGGKGKDDIYRFVEQKITMINIEGQVLDIETDKPIADAKVTIYDQNHNFIAETTADNVGHFMTPIESKDSVVYYIKAESPDYETKEITVNANEIDPKKGIIIRLAKNRKIVEKGDDLAKILDIKNILFNLNKSNIRPDAAVELQKIVQLMNEFPTVKIAIGSHTDSRQSSQNNLILSDKRAKSTRAYLILNGIAANRVTAKGYGETKLLNKCSDGVVCTEAEHQVNRRSEFIVVSK